MFEKRNLNKNTQFPFVLQIIRMRSRKRFDQRQHKPSLKKTTKSGMELCREVPRGAVRYRELLCQS